MASPSKPKTTLLNLPAELRNAIFRYSVLCDEPIHLLRLQWSKSGYDPALIQEPAISRTCRSLRQEVLSIYYGENDFDFGSTSGGHQLSMLEVPDVLERWTRRLGDNAKDLRRIDVSANCEILGPKHAAYSLRDFWEILHFSIQINGSVLEYKLTGDPSFDELCTCELDQEVSGNASEPVTPVHAVLEASKLYFRTTELGECEVCNRSCLTEPAKVNGFIYIAH